jgi:hypothetical protein
MYRNSDFRLLSSPDFIWSFQISGRFFMFLDLYDINQLGSNGDPTKKEYMTSPLSPRPLLIALGLQRHSLGELYVFNII